MPTFDFECSECKKSFEQFIWPNEKVNCPNCNSSDVTKCFTPCNVNSSPGRQKEMMQGDLWRESQTEKHWANWVGAK